MNLPDFRIYHALMFLIVLGSFWSSCQKVQEVQKGDEPGDADIEDSILLVDPILQSHMVFYSGDSINPVLVENYDSIGRCTLRTEYLSKPLINGSGGGNDTLETSFQFEREREIGLSTSKGLLVEREFDNEGRLVEETEFHDDKPVRQSNWKYRGEQLISKVQRYFDEGKLNQVDSLSFSLDSLGRSIKENRFVALPPAWNFLHEELIIDLYPNQGPFPEIDKLSDKTWRFHNEQGAVSKQVTIISDLDLIFTIEMMYDSLQRMVGKLSFQNETLMEELRNIYLAEDISRDIVSDTLNKGRDYEVKIFDSAGRILDEGTVRQGVLRWHTQHSYLFW